MKIHRIVMLAGFVAVVGYAGRHDLPESTVSAAPLVTQESSVEARPGLMWKKLAMVNRIVRGLSTDDFELVEQGSRDLLEVTESAAWASARDPFYHHYSANFEQAVRGLLQAAESRSPEKVTFAYVHVTISCTACHQHVRNVDRLAQ